MAVVKTTLRDLGGSFTVQTRLGAGTQFTLRLPLTLSIADTIIVTVADQLCAVPHAAVQEILQVAPDRVRTVRDVEVLSYRDGLLPLFHLRTLFRKPLEKPDTITLLVLNSERGQIGVIVDRVNTQREVVVRAIKDPLIQVPGFSGATELGNGRPVLILDANTLPIEAVRPLARNVPGTGSGASSFS